MSELGIYQSKSGNWIFWDGKAKHFFVTEAEAIIMSRKVEFVREVQEVSGQFAAMIRAVRDLKGVYTTRGYAFGEKDPILNSDIEPTGTTVTELNASVTMFQQLLNFVDNDVVIRDNYGETINDMRTDV